MHALHINTNYLVPGLLPVFSVKWDKSHVKVIESFMSSLNSVGTSSHLSLKELRQVQITEASPSQVSTDAWGHMTYFNIFFEKLSY